MFKFDMFECINQRIAFNKLTVENSSGIILTYIRNNKCKDLLLENIRKKLNDENISDFIRVGDKIIVIYNDKRFPTLEWLADRPFCLYNSKYNDDFGIIYKLFQNHHTNIQYASVRILSNPILMFKIIKQDVYMVSYGTHNIHNNYKIMLFAIRQDCSLIKHASFELQMNKKILSIIMDKDKTTLAHIDKYIPQEYIIRRKKFLLGIIQADWTLLQYLPNNIIRQIRYWLHTKRQLLYKCFRAYKEIYNKENANKNNFNTDIKSSICRYLLSVGKNDYEIVLYLATRFNGVLDKLSTEVINNFRDNIRIILVSICKNGLNLKYASPRIKNITNLVKIAVNNNGLALKSASARLKDDTEVVRIAVSNNSKAFAFATKKVKAHLLKYYKGHLHENLIKAYSTWHN
jgi:hypothetical protein